LTTEERGNYGTMGKAARLYMKEIRGCSDLLTMSIHEHIVLNVLIYEQHEHYAWQNLLEVPSGGLAPDDGRHREPRDLVL
jgi:hypothetical protein